MAWRDSLFETSDDNDYVSSLSNLEVVVTFNGGAEGGVGGVYVGYSSILCGALPAALTAISVLFFYRPRQAEMISRGDSVSWRDQIFHR